MDIVRLLLYSGADKEAKDEVRGEGRGGGWKMYGGAVHDRGCVEGAEHPQRRRRRAL